MTDISDEMLMAYADNQLPPEERAMLDRLLRGREDLRARLEPFVQTRAGLAAVFEPTLREPVPDRLISAITRAPVAPQSGFHPPSWPRQLRATMRALVASVFPHGFSPALAASLAVLFAAGVATGWLAGHPAAETSLMESAASGLIATGPLAAALETHPSAPAGTSGAPVVPVLSFRSTGGEICREYRAKGPEAGPDFAGLACRAADGTWRIALHVETPKPVQASGTAPYRTAAAPNVPAIDALAETIMAGEALGRDNEAALLRKAWRADAPTGGTAE